MRKCAIAPVLAFGEDCLRLDSLVLPEPTDVRTCANAIGFVFGEACLRLDPQCHYWHPLLDFHQLFQRQTLNGSHPLKVIVHTERLASVYDMSLEHPRKTLAAIHDGTAIRNRVAPKVYMGSTVRGDNMAIVRSSNTSATLW